jgi:hypothetical protein
MRISGLMSGRRVPSYRKSTGRSIFLPIDHNSLIAARGLFSGGFAHSIAGRCNSAFDIEQPRLTAVLACIPQFPQTENVVVAKRMSKSPGSDRLPHNLVGRCIGAAVDRGAQVGQLIFRQCDTDLPNVCHGYSDTRRHGLRS